MLSELHWNRANNEVLNAIAIEVLYTTTQRLEKEEEVSLTRFGWEVLLVDSCKLMSRAFVPLEYCLNASLTRIG